MLFVGDQWAQQQPAVPERETQLSSTAKASKAELCLRAAPFSSYILEFIS